MPSFSIALTGLEANSVALNTIGNNLANLNTTAFKKQTANFADLYYQTLGSSGANSPLQVGIGTKVSSIDTNFSQGNLNTTSNATDMAINGNGFFVVQNQGTQELTRTGNFQLSAAGDLQTSDGLSVLGYPAANGAVNANASLVPLNVPTGKTQLPQATSHFSITAGLNSASAIGTSFPDSTTMYDSLGNSHNVSLNFTKTADNTWSYNIALPAGESTGSANTSGTLTFNTNGTLATPAANLSGITFTGMTDKSADLNLNWQLYNGNGTSLLTQTAASSSVNARSQDGYSSGTYKDFSVDATGVITANYTNGHTDVLGQVALATVANPNGLARAGGNAYKTTEASGLVTFGAAGTGGRGKIVDNSLEGSNVDISTEFADLIVAQRAFEANSKTVTAFDTVTQSTIAMVR